MSDPTLLPCPFCGLFPARMNSVNDMVQHPETICILHGWYGSDAAWNRRAPGATRVTDAAVQRAKVVYNKTFLSQRTEQHGHAMGLEAHNAANDAAFRALLEDFAAASRGEGADARREPPGGVTRVEVIDHRQSAIESQQGGGRSFSAWDIPRVELQYQDNGRTLKIFLCEAVSASAGRGDEANNGEDNGR